MKLIEGTVIAGRPNKLERLALFGRKIHKIKNIGYENFQTNGLLPFLDLKELYDAKHQMQKSGRFEEIIPLHINLAIVKQADSYMFRLANSLIILFDDDLGTTRLLGPRVDGKMGYVGFPCAEIADNGLKTFDSLKKVMYVTNEVARQAQVEMRIGRFTYLNI